MEINLPFPKINKSQKDFWTLSSINERDIDYDRVDMVKQVLCYSTTYDDSVLVEYQDNVYEFQDISCNYNQVIDFGSVPYLITQEKGRVFLYLLETKELIGSVDFPMKIDAIYANSSSFGDLFVMSHSILFHVDICYSKFTLISHFVNSFCITPDKGIIYSSKNSLFLMYENEIVTSIAIGYDCSNLVITKGDIVVGIGSITNSLDFRPIVFCNIELTSSTSYLFRCSDGPNSKVFAFGSNNSQFIYITAQDFPGLVIIDSVSRCLIQAKVESNPLVYYTEDYDVVGIQNIVLYDNLFNVLYDNYFLRTLTIEFVASISSDSISTMDSSDLQFKAHCLDLSFTKNPIFTTTSPFSNIVASVNEEFLSVYIPANNKNYNPKVNKEILPMGLVLTRTLQISSIISIGIVDLLSGSLILCNTPKKLYLIYPPYEKISSQISIPDTFGTIKKIVAVPTQKTLVDIYVLADTTLFSIRINMNSRKMSSPSYMMENVTQIEMTSKLEIIVSSSRSIYIMKDDALNSLITFDNDIVGLSCLKNETVLVFFDQGEQIFYYCFSIPSPSIGTSGSLNAFNSQKSFMSNSSIFHDFCIILADDYFSYLRYKDSVLYDQILDDCYVIDIPYIDDSIEIKCTQFCLASFSQTTIPYYVFALYNQEHFKIFKFMPEDGDIPTAIKYS